MFRNIFSPIRSKFDIPFPRTPPTATSVTFVSTDVSSPTLSSPEAFARDVLVQLMRNSVEELKAAQDARSKFEVLSKIHEVMIQDVCTKDVFRETDGFLVLVNALSTITSPLSSTTDDHASTEIIESVRLVLTIISEAMLFHPINASFFTVHVGIDSFTQAVLPLLSSPITMDHTAGFLFSLALHDFSLSGVFVSLRALTTDSYDAMDAHIVNLSSRLGFIRMPSAMSILWDVFLPLLRTEADALMRYGFYRAFDVLASVGHRNMAVLSRQDGLVTTLLDALYEHRGVQDRERFVLLQLLGRLLDIGSTPADARRLFRRAAVEGAGLNEEVTSLVSAAMKSRWPDHFSMNGCAKLVLEEECMKGMPSTGFTFMAWLWFETLPKKKPHNIFSVGLSTRQVVALSLLPDGKLHFRSSANSEGAVLTRACIQPMRWTHVTLVHYPHRASNPSIRLFVDGALVDALQWQYPRIEAIGLQGTYTFGDDDKVQTSDVRWCIASAYLLSSPLPNDYPRLIHHLGPRYSSSFQDPNLIRFLTYDATTSLNMFLASLSKSPPPHALPFTTTADLSPLVKAVRDGLGVSRSSLLFALSPTSLLSRHNAALAPPSYTDAPPRTPTGWFPNRQGQVLGPESWKIEGDVFLVDAQCLDMALWKIGGAAIGLRLVQVATAPYELSRTLGILLDGIRNNWQNSEDMERLRGYDVLGDILRAKSHLIDMTGFQILFEFLGLSFISPERSTIVNTMAYRSIALDFSLWARTHKDIQRAHLGHFSMLLEMSRHRRFNVKQRIAKMAIVRKLLFALQTEWYHLDMVPDIVNALKVVAQAHFSADDTVKPIVAYLAANIHESPNPIVESPHSTSSLKLHVDQRHPSEKAAQVMEALTSLLAQPPLFAKFASFLPLSRICLLLLGEKPSPFVAYQILCLIRISVSASPSFIRKFELVSGWSVLKHVLPAAWDPNVHEAAFDILLGQARTVGKERAGRQTLKVVCPNIMPPILAALRRGLESVAAHAETDAMQENGSSTSSATNQPSSAIIEVLVEELIDLHASNASFRQLFKSQSITRLYIDAYKSFVSTRPGMDATGVRILEKLTHFGLVLAMDPAVAGAQKHEITDILDTTETILGHRSAEKTKIDPSLIREGPQSLITRFASARLTIQLGERTLHKTFTRLQEWRKTIVTSERKRLRKNILDLQENHRQVSRLYEWALVLTSERGLWANPDVKRKWRLDETEGPHRIREKMEPLDETLLSSRVDDHEQERAVEPNSESQSIVQIEQPPWAESYEISTTEVEEERQLAEEITEDKHRRVRHELEPGDVIEAVSTVARVEGVDSSPGLLIFGKTHLYTLDGLVEDDNGEVIAADDAPKRLFFVPGSIVELKGPQRAQRWTYDQVTSLSTRTFLFRDVALEIYFRDSRSLLIVFLDKKCRREMHQRLSSLMTKDQSLEPRTPGRLKTPLFGAVGTVGTKVLMGFRADELSIAQRKWQTREISNYTYLTIINQISGRTPNDATQYPVFPWVLKDYFSNFLDLKSPDSFRDLTKPMGALTPARCEAAQMRYSNLEGVGEKPFHYGTHFSSSMIICHFLIRLAPFTNMFKTLQGGEWDLPDRLFVDIGRAYESASQDIRGDVRELIPEFFTCPEFLENSANLDFGVQQATGEKINDVKLPPWAKMDPMLFIVLNRQALESEYVSEHLPEWIDLIWGCKQRDPDSLNAFHPLSYEGSIDLDTITDELEREATVGIIHNFGQTPRKIFITPHPPRYIGGPHTLPLGEVHGVAEDAHLLIQGSKPLQELGPVPVRDLVVDTIVDKAVPCEEGVLCLPSRPHEQIHWGPKTAAGELRVLVDDRIIQVIEEISCTCAWADLASVVTGSSDHIVRIWRVSREPTRRHVGTREAGISLVLTHVMRIHSDEIASVGVSRSWSVVVSGSMDGSAAIWDLNKGVYIRSIWHGTQPDSTVHLVAINESTGYIATCSKMMLCLHTINARPLATLDLSPSSINSPIYSIAFHEREYSHLGIIATGASDGTITLRTWNTDNTPEGEKAKWEFVTIRSLKVRTNSGDIPGRGPCITALKFIGENLYHGDDSGRTFSWSLPD